MKNSEHRKHQMQNKDGFTFLECFVLSYSPDPGGVVTIRTRVLNKKYDVFAPLRGFDVMLPAGVVYNFEGLYAQRGCKKYSIVGVLTSFYEKNVSLRSRYDKQGARFACNENRDEEMFPEGCDKP